MSPALQSRRAVSERRQAVESNTPSPHNQSFLLFLLLIPFHENLDPNTPKHTPTQTQGTWLRSFLSSLRMDVSRPERIRSLPMSALSQPVPCPLSPLSQEFNSSPARAIARGCLTKVNTYQKTAARKIPRDPHNFPPITLVIGEAMVTWCLERWWLESGVGSVLPCSTLR